MSDPLVLTVLCPHTQFYHHQRCSVCSSSYPDFSQSFHMCLLHLVISNILKIHFELMNGCELVAFRRLNEYTGEKRSRNMGAPCSWGKEGKEKKGVPSNKKWNMRGFDSIVVNWELWWYHPCSFYNETYLHLFHWTFKSARRCSIYFLYSVFKIVNQSEFKVEVC